MDNLTRAITLSLATACSTSPTSPPATLDATVSDDANVSPDAEIVDVTLGDVGRDAVRDAVRDGARDASSADAMADVASDARMIVDVLVNPGMCGPAVRECLCGCAGEGTCQNACIAASDDCGFCIYVASTRCCPDESRLLDDCIDRNMCVDDGCVRARCGADLRRLESCFATAQRSDEACGREMRRCLGDDYPMIQCVVP